VDENHEVEAIDVSSDVPGTADLAPRVAILGWCDRAVEMSPGHPLWHTHIWGLARARLSCMYPLNLRGLKVVFGVYNPRAGEALQVVFRLPSGLDVARANIAIQRISELGASAVNADQSQGGDGWFVAALELNDDALVMEPCAIRAFYVGTGRETFCGSLYLLHGAVPLFGVEQLQAIKADPLALKFVKARYSCKFCSSELKTYAGIERSEKLEANGYVDHKRLPDRFTCACGKTDFDLKYLRTGLYGLLLRTVDRTADLGAAAVRLYEKTTLEEYCRQFLELLQRDCAEEELQNFLEAHPVFFSRFNPKWLKPKPKIMSKYAADFAILNERRELFLIEIERNTTKLIKADGGLHSELQHAVDQVRRWKQEADDHRSAVLSCLDLNLNDVARIRGIVIAGRTPMDDDHVRLLRAVPWSDIDFYTYDDLLSSVVELVRQIATA
jgi:hypothetical protein